jgi:hypothetical protein
MIYSISFNLKVYINWLNAKIEKNLNKEIKMEFVEDYNVADYCSLSLVCYRITE